MFVYYAKGDPNQRVAPDNFVVKDCEPRNRRVFKIWEEGRVPNMIVELTSLSTRQTDEATKKDLYEQLGVEDYILYDPLGEYLAPPLQGYRLVSGKYEPIPPDDHGGILSRSLGVIFRIEDGELVHLDAMTGEVLLTDTEAVDARLDHTVAELDQTVAELDQTVAKLDQTVAQRDEAVRAQQKIQTELDNAKAAQKAMQEELDRLREAAKRKAAGE